MGSKGMLEVGNGWLNYLKIIHLTIERVITT